MSSAPRLRPASHLLVHDEDASTEFQGNAVVLDVIGLADNGADSWRTVSDHPPLAIEARFTADDD